MTRVKICGITSVDDARLAVDLGADYLGLNFYPASPRYLEPERAAAIAEAVRGRVPLVGVFVNTPRQRIEAIDARVGLDHIQLHGDEGPDAVVPFGSRAIKVFRRAEPPEASELAAYGACWGYLFDVADGTRYGGTGREWSYRTLAGLATPKPYFVAGGIRPGNAARAARESGAFGVDVCSGVESAPGVKDRSKLEQLLAEVRDGQG